MTTPPREIPDFVIDGRPIGPKHRPYVIAEMSGNHNGDIERAKALIDAAKAAGADAVKLQTYTADTLTIPSSRPEFRIDGGLWAGRTLHDLYHEAHTPWAWHPELFAHARDIGVTIFSSPFDDTAVELLQHLEAPAYKIASAEIVDWGLLDTVARTGKPVIVSTGMANDAEIGEALGVLRAAGAHQIMLLHCISAYPTPLSEANLCRIPYLRERFGVQVGLSDHTMGIQAAQLAAALGAVCVEKHFTLARADGGVDSAFSLEKEELAAFVTALGESHAALGSPDVEIAPSEAATLQFRRSLYFVKSLRKGEAITAAHVRSIRPGAGLPPRHLSALIGRHAAADIEEGTPADWDLIGE
jgi:N-acetylneuraminate synthase